MGFTCWQLHTNKFASDQREELELPLHGKTPSLHKALTSTLRTPCTQEAGSPGERWLAKPITSTQSALVCDTKAYKRFHNHCGLKLLQLHCSESCQEKVCTLAREQERERGGGRERQRLRQTEARKSTWGQWLTSVILDLTTQHTV